MAAWCAVAVTSPLALSDLGARQRLAQVLLATDRSKPSEQHQHVTSVLEDGPAGALKDDNSSAAFKFVNTLVKLADTQAAGDVIAPRPPSTPIATS